MIDIYSRLMPAAQAHPGPREEFTEGFLDACIDGFDGVIPDTIHSDIHTRWCRHPGVNTVSPIGACWSRPLSC